MQIVIAIAILGGLGLVFGLVLAAASKIFYVESDPRLDQLNECLPGANCGGCGYAGCGAYAEAVLKGEAPIGKCASGGNEAAQAMAATTAVSTSVLTQSPDRTCRPIVFSMCSSSFRDFWLPLYGKCDMVKIFNLFFFYKVSLGGAIC